MASVGLFHVNLHFQSPSEGNWIHIHYQSRLQAKKALSKSSKIFAGNLMIGVAQCIDKVSHVE